MRYTLITILSGLCLLTSCTVDGGKDIFDVPQQAGFRKARGTRNQTANIRWIIEKARKFQRNIYFCFIDSATCETPPPISTIIFPTGDFTLSPAPRAAAMGEETV